MYDGAMNQAITKVTKRKGQRDAEEPNIEMTQQQLQFLQTKLLMLIQQQGSMNQLLLSPQRNARRPPPKRDGSQQKLQSDIEPDSGRSRSPYRAASPSNDRRMSPGRPQSPGRAQSPGVAQISGRASPNRDKTRSSGKISSSYDLPDAKAYQMASPSGPRAVSPVGLRAASPMGRKSQSDVIKYQEQMPHLKRAPSNEFCWSANMGELRRQGSSSAVLEAQSAMQEMQIRTS